MSKNVHVMLSWKGIYSNIIYHGLKSIFTYINHVINYTYIIDNITYREMSRIFGNKYIHYRWNIGINYLARLCPR